MIDMNGIFRCSIANENFDREGVYFGHTGLACFEGDRWRFTPDSNLTLIITISHRSDLYFYEQDHLIN
jgi:hypothetical protein